MFCWLEQSCWIYEILWDALWELKEFSSLLKSYFPIISFECLSVFLLIHELFAVCVSGGKNLNRMEQKTRIRLQRLKHFPQEKARVCTEKMQTHWGWIMDQRQLERERACMIFFWLESGWIPPVALGCSTCSQEWYGYIQCACVQWRFTSSIRRKREHWEELGSKVGQPSWDSHLSQQINQSTLLQHQCLRWEKNSQNLSWQDTVTAQLLIYLSIYLSRGSYRSQKHMAGLPPGGWN